MTWMCYNGQLSIGLLDLKFRSIWLDTQGIIIGRVKNHGLVFCCSVEDAQWRSERIQRSVGYDACCMRRQLFPQRRWTCSGAVRLNFSESYTRQNDAYCTV
jgi:hypothetical protein